MKRNMLSVFAVLAFTVLVAGVSYAHGNQDSWCTGDTGWNHIGGSNMGTMMGSNDGHMMGPYGGQMGSGSGQMGPGYGQMGPYAGHMGGSTTGHMTARHDGKNGNFDCSGWDTENQNTGNHYSGSK